MDSRNNERLSKRVYAEGEPASKRHCSQLSEKSSRYSKPFNGQLEEKNKVQPAKRNAPQDNLSAQIYVRKLAVF
ncbi:Ovule protein [Caenorhabditis elegans]|uniref:Ovule protein n=1 Tax=Caenorhabditis elegans TaxID=6239 RepID=G1K0V5_CAEEL|nr:Ovule protein [Caenorhabditis elegans]CCD66327.1 Ovule protein [Caenorhabditis elegans]|eukprot:NP_001257017.1 Uncharacterized protein CELE_C31H2.14 [Caenorhabditis elegans]